MRIGILTGGGDAPGLNAVIRAVVYKAHRLGHLVIGFKRGWAGALASDFEALSLESVEDIHMQGGTILGSSRTNVAKVQDGFEIVKKNLAVLGVDALIAIGGEDTLGVAKQLADTGGKCVGVPKTIDNDVNATDYTFGFDTAINRAMEAMDNLHTTARSHHRVMVVEIMGRHAGWMALEAGMAGGAHIILIPEENFKIDDVCRIIKERADKGKKYTMLAVAEGAEDPDLRGALLRGDLDAFGHARYGTGVTIGQVLEKEIEQRTGLEARSVILGHLQRGGPPTAFDRVLGTRYGLKAVEMVEKGQWGYMAALRGNEIIAVPLSEGVGELKTVPLSRYEEAKLFFG